MAHKKDIDISSLVPANSLIAKSMVGKKYGRLTVLEFLGKKTNGKTKKMIVKAVCECGSIHTYDARPIYTGKSFSCGCLQSELTSKRNTKHGQKSPKHGKRGTVMYSRWRSMFDRVRSDHRYANVQISDRWKGENGFVNFCEDLGPMPTPKHTLDRYPVIKGNYEPGNVRWATQKEQMQNVEKNVNVLHNGELLCLSEIARRESIDASNLNYYFRKKNMKILDAIKKCVEVKNKRNANTK